MKGLIGVEEHLGGGVKGGDHVGIKGGLGWVKGVGVYKLTPLCDTSCRTIGNCDTRGPHT